MAKRTFNVGFQRYDKEDGLINDETQFDLEDAEFGTMFCQLNQLFEDFGNENKWGEFWISYVDEVPYDGDNAE